MTQQRRCAGCPTPNGCGCLASYANDQAAYLAALHKATGTVLTVVTPDPAKPRSLELACNNTMTCPCRTCSHERVTRRPQAVKQPWEAKKAA